MVHQRTKLFRPLKFSVDSTIERLAVRDESRCELGPGRFPTHFVYAFTKAHTNLIPNNQPLCRYCHNYHMWKDDGKGTLWSPAVIAYVQLICDFANSAYGRHLPGTIPRYATAQLEIWDTYKHSASGRNPIWFSAVLSHHDYNLSPANFKHLKYLFVLIPNKLRTHIGYVAISPVNRTVEYIDSGASGTDYAAVDAVIMGILDFLAAHYDVGDFVPAEWRIRARSARQPKDRHDNNCGVYAATNILCQAFGYPLWDFGKENMLDRRKRMACDFSNGGFQGQLQGVDLPDESYYTVDPGFDEGRDGGDGFRSLPEQYLDRFPQILRGLHSGKFEHLRTKEDIRAFVATHPHPEYWRGCEDWLQSSYDFAFRMLVQRDMDIQNRRWDPRTGDYDPLFRVRWSAQADAAARESRNEQSRAALEDIIEDFQKQFATRPGAGRKRKGVTPESGEEGRNVRRRVSRTSGTSKTSRVSSASKSSGSPTRRSERLRKKS